MYMYVPASEYALSSIDGNENDNNMYVADLVNLAPSPLILISIGECRMAPLSNYNNNDYQF